MTTDLTFITNEPDASLLNRFKVLIKDCKAFDALVGYFFASGFHSIFKSLEDTEHIRVLVGISTDRMILASQEAARQPAQMEMNFSHAEVKEQVEQGVVSEFEESEDSHTVEEGVAALIEWLKAGKLEIKAYPTRNIHAKLYIMTFAESDRDIGRVITGSSNFTQAGLVDNLEFNVELKNSADYEFALDKFNDLWKNAVDISEKYLETIRTKTWYSDEITPYELYLKFLYEYFREELNRTEDVFYRFVPDNFRKLKYQEQAVLSGKRILEEYGGVFISDVVGLGKTYICALLSNQLDGRHLVIAPPVLLDRNNPGSWPNVFKDFNIPATFESIGKLDKLIAEGTEKYDYVIIDEAHRFRSESNITYEALARICRGKKVILVTATPYNNHPSDILSQIKLFQSGRKSTIPNMPNLDGFFGQLTKKLKGLDRQKDPAYMEIVKENAKDIREKVLKYLMVRRTRSDVVRYFGGDLTKQGLKFPEVEDPKPLYYELNDQENAIFDQTIKYIAQALTYARYTPKLYLQKDLAQAEQLSQRNMGSLMKILLVKRFDSSIYAFRQSVGRFIESYRRFIQQLEDGQIYISKRYSEKIYEMLDNDDDEAIQRLIEEGDAEVYAASDFIPEFAEKLKADLDILLKVQEMWTHITRDIKLITLEKRLISDSVLKNSKLLIFTESRETANYLSKQLDTEFNGKVLFFAGGSSASDREKVIENFDARARQQKDDYRMLVSTEVLSEGVNLHRSNVVINYDIPWNPTRLMQRVGRVNRVDTPFDTIHTYNFFPTQQSNDEIKLKEAAEAKITAFISMLGADARLLLEGEEIESHELFNRLFSKAAIIGTDEDSESELKYLNAIKDIRDNNQDLFEKIKRLPKKARTARLHNISESALLTYFRKGKLQKFFLAEAGGQSDELDFMSAAGMLEASPDVERDPLGKDFYDMLGKNKQKFDECTDDEIGESIQKGSKSSAARLLAILKTFRKDMRQLTEDQEQYLQTVMFRLDSGSIPKQTAKTALDAIQDELKKEPSILRAIGVLQKTVPAELLEAYAVEKKQGISSAREVILSEYYRGQ